MLRARDGRLHDVDVRELAVGDWVALSYDSYDAFPEQPVTLGAFSLSPSRCNQKSINVPRVLDEDLALLLGMYASEGHTKLSTWTIDITNSVPAVLERAVELWRVCFGIEARVAQYGTRCASTVAASKSVVEVMNELRCGSRASKSEFRLESWSRPGRSRWHSCRGCGSTRTRPCQGWRAGGCVWTARICWTTCRRCFGDSVS